MNQIYVCWLALAATSKALHKQLGTESEWAWGKLATYHWRTDATLMKPHMSSLEQAVVGVLGDYMDRGPYPAGGNRNTLIVAGYDLVQDFEVWNILAMRMVVGFSQPEPMNIVVAGRSLRILYHRIMMTVLIYG